MKRFSPPLLLPAISLISFLVFLAMRILLVFSTEADLGGIENNVIYSICKVLEGGALYENPENGNFNISQYSPLYYYLVTGLCQMFRLEPIENLYEIYIVARFLSLFFNLLSLVVVFIILRGIYKISWPFLMPALAFSFLQFSRIHFSARPDALASFLFLLTVFFILKSLALDQKNSRKITTLILATFVISIGVFTKQSGVQLLFIPLFYFFIGEKKLFYISSVGIVFFSLTMFGWFYLIYGEAFTQNTVGGLNNGVSLAQGFDVFSHYSSLFQMVILVAAALIFLKKSSAVDRSRQFLRLLLVITFLFAVISSIKLGSWINYYNEFTLAAVLFITIELNQLFAENLTKSFSENISALFIKICLVFMLPNLVITRYFHENSNQFSFDTVVYEKRRRLAHSLKEELNVNHYFVSFDPYLNAMLPLNAAIPNKDLLPPVSKFDYSRFSQLAALGKVRIWVFPAQNKTTAFLGVNLQEYTQEVVEDGLLVLRP
jgi:hypothetical protein